MEKIIEFIKNNPILSLILPSVISGGTFFGNLLIAISDGVLDTNELHTLMSSANGFELVVLLVIMIALKSKDKK